MPDDKTRLELTERLAEVAEGLRDAEHLDPEARSELAALLLELSQAVAAAELPAEQFDHLKASTAHLAKAIHQQPPHGVLASARQRLEQAVLVSETRAPVLSGITRRLIDVLTSIGI